MTGDLSQSWMLSENFYFSLAYVSDSPDYSFTFHRTQSYSVSQKAEFGALLKTFISRHECKLEIQSRLINLTQTPLFKLFDKS
jgi:hypothetical protein